MMPFSWKRLTPPEAAAGGLWAAAGGCAPGAASSPAPPLPPQRRGQALRWPWPRGDTCPRPSLGLGPPCAEPACLWEAASTWEAWTWPAGMEEEEEEEEGWQRSPQLAQGHLGCSLGLPLGTKPHRLQGLLKSAPILTPELFALSSVRAGGSTQKRQSLATMSPPHSERVS